MDNMASPTPTLFITLEFYCWARIEFFFPLTFIFFTTLVKSAGSNNIFFFQFVTYFKYLNQFFVAIFIFLFIPQRSGFPQIIFFNKISIPFSIDTIGFHFNIFLALLIFDQVISGSESPWYIDFHHLII